MNSEITEFPGVENLVSWGALFVLNHSGGKDSQAMTALVRKLVPADQIVVVHAHLPGVEWTGTAEHVRNNIGDLPYIEAVAVKTFFEMVEHRKMFPSPANRQCTSDLKRGPIERDVRRYLSANPQFNGLVVNCMGLRAEESPGRAKLASWKKSKRNSKNGREWYDWLPIHDLKVAEVFTMIANAGQVPHWAYSKGMTRLSCVFCIMASPEDLATAAKLNPELYAKYVETEKRLDFTMNMAGKPLEEITGIPSSF